MSINLLKLFCISFAEFVGVGNHKVIFSHSVKCYFIVSLPATVELDTFSEQRDENEIDLDADVFLDSVLVQT